MWGCYDVTRFNASSAKKGKALAPMQMILWLINSTQHCNGSEGTTPTHPPRLHTWTGGECEGRGLLEEWGESGRRGGCWRWPGPTLTDLFSLFEFRHCTVCVEVLVSYITLSLNTTMSSCFQAVTICLDKTGSPTACFCTHYWTHTHTPTHLGPALTLTFQKEWHKNNYQMPPRDQPQVSTFQELLHIW